VSQSAVCAFNTGPYTVLPDNSILITANMQSETGFLSSHQLKSYVASKSRVILAARAVLSADAGLFVWKGLLKFWMCIFKHTDRFSAKNMWFLVCVALFVYSLTYSWPGWPDVLWPWPRKPWPWHFVLSYVSDFDSRYSCTFLENGVEWQYYFWEEKECSCIFMIRLQTSSCCPGIFTFI